MFVNNNTYYVLLLTNIYFQKVVRNILNILEDDKKNQRNYSVYVYTQHIQINRYERKNEEKKY